ncbi:MAG: quinone oxidoreductase family protein [Bacillota bacterium]
MKAAVLEGFGEVESLVVRDVEVPVPGPGQVLVRMRAAGLNFADVLWRRGLYPRSRFPHVLGFEIAGEVVSVGDGVSTFVPGQRVFGSTAGGGGYAEYGLAPAELLLPVPDGLSFEEAAAMPVIFGTVYYALVPMGRLSPGEIVLIHAAGGGVGTVAVQWAKALGATVVATAGSDEKLERVRALGADVLINYRERNMSEAVREAVGKVDLVLESIGGRVLEESLGLLRPFGRLITFGYASGESASVDPLRLFSRNLTISGLYLGAMAPPLIARGMAEGAAIVMSGKVRPIVGHTFPLDQIREAHRLLEGRSSFGKVIITP